MLDQFGKIGENTWNSRLASELRSKGLNTADFEILFPTFRGRRKPDVSFQAESGIGIVSAKLGESREVEAIASAQEYQQTIGKTMNLAETFSLTYPAEKEKEFRLRVLANQQHGTASWTFPSLSDVADRIYDISSGKWDKARLDIENSVNAAIRVLRTGVLEFSNTLGRIPLKDYELLFGGADFFESVLGYDSTKENREYVLRSAASYLFVNQILFYEILSRETGSYPQISEEDIDKPELIKPKYFDLVLAKDYQPIFNFDIAGQIRGKNAHDACRKIILAIRALFPGEIEHDLIGKVFHSVIPRDFRKVVAAYFTNSAAGDLLARLSIQSTDDRVIDLACGSGTLLVSAYKRKLELSGTKTPSDVHKKYVERELTGIDIMPFSAHLAAVNLSLMAPKVETDNVRIAIEDSTTLYPGKIIPPVKERLKEAFRSRRLTDYFGTPQQERKEKIKAGTVSLSEKPAKPIHLEKVDVVIMNPPFTSCDNLPADYKITLKERFSDRAGCSGCLTGKISFQAYFLLLADRFLKDDGSIACVIPLTTLMAEAFEKLDNYILGNFKVRYIVYGIGRSAFSDNTSLTEILFIAEKGKPTKKESFVLIATKKNPEEWNANDIDEIVKQARLTERRNQRIESRYAITKNYLQTDLRQDALGLTSMINFLDLDFARVSAEIERIYGTSSIMTDFETLASRSGLEIFEGGAFAGSPIPGYSAISYSSDEGRMNKKSDRFLIIAEDTARITVKDRFSDGTFTIQKKFLRPQVRRLSGQKTLDISTSTDCVVKRHFDGLDRIAASIYDVNAVRVNLQHFRQQGTRKINGQVSRIVFARRLDISAPGSCLLAVYSEEPAFVSANAWGIRDIDRDDAKLMTLWINSCLFLFDLLARRASTRGAFGQLDKRYLSSIRCPSFSRLKERDRIKLVALFDEIREEEFPSIVSQIQEKNKLKMRIDDVFLAIIGVPSQERERIMNDLYKVLTDRITAMQATMSQD